MNEPTLWRPTAKQTSVIDQSVFRSRAAARSRRRVNRYWWGDSPNTRENSTAEVGGGQARHPGEVPDGERLGVAGVGQVLRPQQVAGRMHGDRSVSPW